MTSSTFTPTVTLLPTFPFPFCLFISPLFYRYTSFFFFIIFLFFYPFYFYINLILFSHSIHIFSHTKCEFSLSLGEFLFFLIILIKVDGFFFLIYVLVLCCFFFNIPSESLLFPFYNFGWILVWINTNFFGKHEFEYAYQLFE